MWRFCREGKPDKRAGTVSNTVGAEICLRGRTAAFLIRIVNWPRCQPRLEAGWGLTACGAGPPLSAIRRVNRQGVGTDCYCVRVGFPLHPGLNIGRLAEGQLFSMLAPAYRTDDDRPGMETNAGLDGLRDF